MPYGDVALQVRCCNCGREQYAPAVYPISHGEHACCWCGMPGEKMANDAYQLAMKKCHERMAKLGKKFFKDAIRRSNVSRKSKGLPAVVLE